MTSLTSSPSETATPRSSPALSRTSSYTSFSENVGLPKAAPQRPGLRRLDSELKPVTNICFVGAGYVGGPTAAVIALANPQIHVAVVDKNESRVRQWKSRHLPIYEPGLHEIVRVARDGISLGEHGVESELPQRQPNLLFSTECDKHIRDADIVFLSVSTPTKTVGVGAGAATNISIFESALRSVAMVAKPGAIIVEKSTVPCRTAQMAREILDVYRPGVSFEILSNPEFLAEGTAVSDLLSPSRVLIGSANTASGLAAAAILASVYTAWVPPALILNVHLWSSELAKLVANAMLAQRVSSINTISAICERTGANISDISKAIGSDLRIGAKFLNSGLGFGGSCFKKDILSLSYLAESLDLPEVAAYWKSVVDINEWQCERFVNRVIKSLNGSLSGKKITLLGYAFKKNTSDTRESQSIPVVGQLLKERPCEIAIYDPGCTPHAVEAELGSIFADSTTPSGPIRAYDDPYAACAASDAVLILTEWDEFRYPAAACASVTAVQSCVQDALARLANIKPGLWEPGVAQQRFFSAEPACARDCSECGKGAKKEHGSSNRSQITSLDWEIVQHTMRMPRWVFDGRGVVDSYELEKLGFRVEAVGRVGSRSRLSGFESCY